MAESYGGTLPHGHDCPRLARVFLIARQSFTATRPGKVGPPFAIGEGMEQETKTNGGRAVAHASKTKMTTDLEGWQRRGCLYDFTHCGVTEDGTHEIMVDAYTNTGNDLWVGNATWRDGDTVAKVLREAKAQADGWKE